ncbi:Slc35a3 [Symbiodinium sp. CCMP2456]|nr:Slc35a3 [Symbiodinium sp. CCMP2456]
MPELPEEAVPASGQLSLPSRPAEHRLRGDLAATSRDLPGLSAQACLVEDMMQASRRILGDVCLKQLEHLTAPSEQAPSAAQLRQVRALVEVQEDLRRTLQDTELRSHLQEQSLHRKELEEQKASSQQALEEQKELFEKALKEQRETLQKTLAATAASPEQTAADAGGGPVLPAADGFHSASSKALAAEEVGVPIDQVPRGLRLDDLLRLVQDHKEWLEGPTEREKMMGRKNMYDVTPELIIVATTCEERIVELSAEDADSITKSLAAGDDAQSHGVFVKGSLQCRQGAVLGGVLVENLVIQGILSDGGKQRTEYWKHGSERQQRWRTTGRHGRRRLSQDAIPEKLLGKQLGETSARRQKELLKKPGTVVVLRSGVAFVDVVEQGEFAPLCAFVSHFWGEETLSFAKSLRLHAETVHPQSPGAMCYYICSFSNCQHLVDLGSDWECSPFNRALQYVAACRRVKQDSVYCAVMLFDDRCSTLERIWCIFEIWRCCQLELRLDLFSVEGQLTRGSSTPLACEIRERTKVLDVSNTECSEMSDKRMIEAAVQTSGSSWAQIAGAIQLQITDLVEFSASLAISRNALTGQKVTAEDVEMRMSDTSQVRNSLSIISDCVQGQLKRILVVGQGGTGKTVFAREVVRRAAQARKEGRVQETVIPLRVPLAELADIKVQGVDLFQAWAERAFGSDSDEILRGDRRLVLVLDGLDEAATARRRILNWLQQWLQANGHRCICTIIASRPSGTNQTEGAGQQWQRSRACGVGRAWPVLRDVAADPSSPASCAN